jgi:acetylornithine deacetylase/succinyl-diaminopimelate desuccinylase-like protein
VRTLGGEAELREDGRLVVGEIAGPQGAPTVLVYGHYDVQPPAPLELWESDPFAAEVRGEWLYARGVADDKGQLWMQLKAIAELVAEGPPPVTFRVVCDGEEETGGDAITRFLERDEGPVDACVVLDGWMKRRNSPEFVVATRGLVALDVEVRTGERDLHSGHYGGTALNAIHALAQALTALFPRGGRLPEPLRAGVTPPSEDEASGWLELPPGAEELARVGAVPLDERADEDFYERVFVEPSLDLTGILGGKPGLRNTTLVSRASAGITIRVAPGQDPAVLADAAEALLRDALPAGASLELSSRDLTPPAVLPRDTEVLALARDAFEGVFGRRPLIVRVGGTLPITAALAARQLPTVLAGLALPDSHTHSPNERMLLETFPLGVAAVRETYRAIGARAGASD